MKIELCRLILKQINEIKEMLDDYGISASKKYYLRKKLDEQKKIYFNLVREE